MPAAVLNHPFFQRDGAVPRGAPTPRAASADDVGQPSTKRPRRREIEMYLANNSITRLPAELFRVPALAVLSLRSNGLKTIPPQIVHLTALRELNIAQNKLRWLPAEMLQMRITTLVVSGNPWISPPFPITQASETDAEATSSQHPISETVVHFPIPPLTEICLRSLVTPYNPSPHSSGSTCSTDVDAQPHHAPQPQPYPLTVLEGRYELPLTEDLDISPPIFATLRACVPAAVSRPAGNPLPTKIMRADGRRDVHARRPDRRADLTHDSDSDSNDVFAPRVNRAGTHTSSIIPDNEDEDEHEHEHEDEITGVSTCPSPRHRTASTDGVEAWRDGRVPVFVRHAEERYTWEEEIAGVRVTETEGGVRVPVCWRGCARGCLAFLDPPPPPPPPPATAYEPPAAPDADEDPHTEVRADADEDGDSDADMDVEMQDFSLGGGLADAADFDEAF
ncbi:hypothetical protein C8Q80DRAFT_174090 [Daedaleopsis nitida]|nr:hypothetical protein C8Q80DRAFT_174090 [Daedaleopsis nitida]